MDDQIKIKGEEILAELYKFSRDMMYLGPGIYDARLESFEQKIGHLLPDDFKFILKKHNGLSLSGIAVYGLDINLKGSSLDEVYEYEHFKVDHKMPLEFLPFSPDGRGNHYCLDLSRLEGRSCPVVFWQWDFQYASIEAVETCNDSLYDWLDEVMIGWTLEEYDYDGSFKN